jgi:hypothetical protein
VTVRNGTYRGDCLVHCDETVAVSPESVTYSLTSKVADARNPDIHAESAPPPGVWEELEGALDWSAVTALPERVGLPDAADAGGEFLEVSRDGESKRIDFPEGSEVPELGSLLSALRDLRTRLAGEHRG